MRAGDLIILVPTFRQVVPGNCRQILSYTLEFLCAIQGFTRLALAVGAQLGIGSGLTEVEEALGGCDVEIKSTFQISLEFRLGSPGVYALFMPRRLLLSAQQPRKIGSAHGIVPRPRGKQIRSSATPCTAVHRAGGGPSVHLPALGWAPRRVS